MKLRMALYLFCTFLVPQVVWPENGAFVPPTSRDKCPVCGMFVARYEGFLAEIVFGDGAYAVFDGAKDLFRYYFNIKEFAPSRKISDFKAVWVTDYYSVRPIDATKAYFVMGSDVTGPMGEELIPFLKEDDAKEFLKDHAGKWVLRMQEIESALPKVLP